MIKKVTYLLLSLKVLLMIVFSSDYLNKLFFPFVADFIHNTDNPYQRYFTSNSEVSLSPFPYPPLMLYIHSFFVKLYYLLGVDSLYIRNFFFKIPSLLSDILISFLLLKNYKDKEGSVLIFYICSPIIIYAIFMHSQLDLIPTALFFWSIYLVLEGKLVFAALILGLGLSTKFHIIAGLPLLCIYILKRSGLLKAILFAIIPILIYLFISYPYLFSDGYIYLVMTNPKQMQIYDVIYSVGHLKIILPILALSIIYIRFLTYSKINSELLFGYLTMLFSVFVLLVIPAPGWYVWMFPFISIFFINAFQNNRRVIYIYLSLNTIYLVFFVFFYKPEIQDLYFLDVAVNWKIENENLRNLFFTLQEAILAYTIYFIYKYAIRSNQFYKRNSGSFIIGIAGDSSTGKTTLLEDLSEVFSAKGMILLEGDGDHKWERGSDNWTKYTHLNPRANFLYRQLENLKDLKKGKPIERVDYDHSSGTFTSPIRIHSADYIILSGLHTFYLPKARKIIDVKIYMDTEDRLRTHWKILRDTVKRGYSKEKVLTQIESRKEDVKKYIYPQKEYADLSFQYFTDNEFELGDTQFQPKIKLKIVLDSNINLDSIMEIFESNQIPFYHDYEPNLLHQFLILEDSIDEKLLYQIVYSNISNLDEIILNNKLNLKKGFRGVIQFFTLLIVSNKLKDYFA